MHKIRDGYMKYHKLIPSLGIYLFMLALASGAFVVPVSVHAISGTVIDQNQTKYITPSNDAYTVTTKNTTAVKNTISNYTSVQDYETAKFDIFNTQLQRTGGFAIDQYYQSIRAVQADNISVLVQLRNTTEQLALYDLQGNLQWSYNVTQQFGYDYISSMIGDRISLNSLQFKGNSAMINLRFLNKTNAETLWNKQLEIPTD